jgi:LDH2 family malate/lactate/ureidoglycolate dehydrogenase
MNTPPMDGRRVPVEVLRGFVADIFAAVPVPADDAQLIADLLIETELRGVVSHGVLQVERYVKNYKEGMTNTHPEIKVLREGPTTAALSGEGGAGDRCGHPGDADGD